MTAVDPILRFRELYAQAALQESFDASRCALATTDAAGRPSVRFVLVKETDARGFHFYTNYESRKARDLEANPRAALAFHWSTIGVQFRVEGLVERLEDELSDDYFARRIRGSQVGAWASPQSRPIDSRATLEREVERVAARFEGGPIPRPAFWGGYRLVPEEVELWFDGTSRLHDRVLYRLEGGTWRESRLAP